jgi:phosphoribosylformylglycinamidine synthase
MVTDDAGADVALDGHADAAELLFHEQPGRVVIETDDADAVEEAFEGVAPVERVGTADDSGALSLTANDETLHYGVDVIQDLRSVIEDELA